MPDVPPVFKRRTASKIKKGGSATLRDHSAAYGRLRAQMPREGLCRTCFNSGLIVPAEVVDRILALSLGGSNNPHNLQPLCRACNDAKSLDERRYLQRRYDPADVRFDPAMARWFKLAHPGQQAHD